MSVYLKELFLGNVDGDTESSKDDFLNLFYKGNNSYDEIDKNPLKFMIYGKKGTGKTVLGRYIEQVYTNQEIICKIFNKDNIILGKLIEKNHEALSESIAVYMFKWIIYHNIYMLLKDKKVKRDRKQYKIFRWIELKRDYKGAMKSLSSIFDERYGNSNFAFDKFKTQSETTVQSEMAVDKDIVEIMKSKVNMQAKKGEVKEVEYYRKEFHHLIEKVEREILTCLRITSVVIILDDLDELEINFNSDENSIIGLNKLVETFKQINILFSSEKLQKSKCILLLRSDIIETLNKRSSNLNKIIQDNSVELYWIEKEKENPEKHMLMEMILNKIKCTCKEYENYSNKDLYKKLFPDKVNSDSAITYLINYSFGRPRDIICYLNIIKDTYPNSERFTGKMFRKCRQKYSEALLKELENEMKIHLPVNVSEDYINLIRDYGRNSFFPSEIKKYYKRNRKNYKNITDINKCLETLYRFGVLGNTWQIGNDKIGYSWAYRKDGNPRANMGYKFTVHYGLRYILNTNRK